MFDIMDLLMCRGGLYWSTVFIMAGCNYWCHQLFVFCGWQWVMSLGLPHGNPSPLPVPLWHGWTLIELIASRIRSI